MEMIVHRRRKTRFQWKLATDAVSVGAGGVPFVTGLERIRAAVEFQFEIAVAGGGVSVIRMSATPASFAEIMEAMMRVNAKATREAFAYAESLEYEEPSPGELQDGDFLPRAE